ncbi:MAG: hypothetical protein LBC80_10610 [Treponema sp.]|nr:hypothetical protein [Treponema sp.]
MRILFAILCLTVLNANPVFSDSENRMDLSFYASTKAEMILTFASQWTFPFLQGESMLTQNNNIALNVSASISPIMAGLNGSTVLTVFPFLTFTAGARGNVGWNYDIFGMSLVGLGLNRRTNIDDPNDGVIGKGLDGLAWDTHIGSTFQFDFGAIFPGDWNHVVILIYNEIRYFAYTKANNNELWYYIMDEGLNINSFQHQFQSFLGYRMPVFVDLVGVQFAGTLPIYNFDIGNSVREIGYSLTTALVVNFRINESFSVMSLARFNNALKFPVTSAYEREWIFNRVEFIATWNLK